MNDLKTRVVIGQTQTLGVGVNMQMHMRAMHHLDAPWMPGELEQRNGRGQRQGNHWNTVQEYRYLTEGMDGRRWQVLAIKDRFIKDFMHADGKTRIIEGDAVDDSTSMSADDIASTLSEASGDPRILIAKKLEKAIERLNRRERAHTAGIADAERNARSMRRDLGRYEEQIAAMETAERRAAAALEADFTATIDGKTYSTRKEAQEAMGHRCAAQGLSQQPVSGMEAPGGIRARLRC